ncbi:MAG: indolepyruvate ferredoxin oxidoreductase subunit alpha [Deferribacteraceae bacterium]|jgi:indolepyruvate ferredoxin oxidoreductase alpha subunit|nr:indolepyruvate ferredoxin oxidoreductase subunit alpha [Deferribacteraceae bacterium]
MESEPLLLSGNEAIAYAALDAGVSVASSYPGTPSTEITECIASFNEIYTEWAVNEKTAFETAMGASMAGVRAFTAMKHVGLNVASDPLMTASYTGINGGFVLAVADDPHMYSSQNEQDSRHYARFAKLPMLEPTDSQEAYLFTLKAFEISEKHLTPVIIRSVTRVSHTYSPVVRSKKLERKTPYFKREPARFVMAPANARVQRISVEKRLSELSALSAEYLEFYDRASAELVISSGIAAAYVQEALPNASLLKLGMVYPIPFEKIREIASRFSKLYLIEELDRFLERELMAEGIPIQPLPRNLCGELSPADLKGLIAGGVPAKYSLKEKLPLRLPNMCPGCSHRGIFYALHRLRLAVLGDIGCYTLAYMPPLSALDSCICMGSSVCLAHGVDKASKELSRKAAAVIGDSTFFHTGINGLINAVYNKSSATIIILDNRTTGMTGHQPNPASGFRINGESAPKIDFEGLVRALGVKRVVKVDPFEPDECIKAIRQETAAEELSVIITTRPCIFAERGVIKPPLAIASGSCSGCKVCIQLSCPAISWDGVNKKASIDALQCTGCFLCQKVCKFNAIVGESA